MCTAESRPLAKERRGLLGLFISQGTIEREVPDIQKRGMVSQARGRT